MPDSSELVENQRPKCCPLHPAAANRSQRREADRLCPCRGECGHHPPISGLSTGDGPS